MGDVFHFGFVEDDNGSTGPGQRYGRIQIDDFEEEFPVDLTFWDERQYKDDWSRRLYRCCSGKDTFLIQSLPAPLHEMNFVMLWVLYPREDTIHVQERLFMTEPVRDLDEIEHHLGALAFRCEDGDPISTWSIDRSAVCDFLSGGFPPDVRELTARAASQGQNTE